MNILRKSIASILFVWISATAIAGSELQAKESVEQSMQQFVASVNAGELQELPQIYNENAVMMPPSSEILRGTEQIVSYWNGLKQQGIEQFAIYSVETTVQDNVAYQSVLWTAMRNTAEGLPISFDGNMSNVLMRDSTGHWVITLQSWN